MATPDEIGDPQNLAMTLDINGDRKQDGNTDDMIFGVYHLVAYISQFMTLEAGDVITTGTPNGVGLGLKPPQFLKAGDTIDVAIEKLGEQHQVCIDAE
jgi:2-keto-4-pentenoate hydratase/2-oxohepta-3-ene-1,7-dioic acid hydratase in catechol pathway